MAGDRLESTFPKNLSAMFHICCWPCTTLLIFALPLFQVIKLG